MHSIKDKPVVVNGEIVIRPIMVVALTYDHRLLDGREAVTFLGAYPFWMLKNIDLCSYSEGSRLHRGSSEDVVGVTRYFGHRVAYDAKQIYFSLIITSTNDRTRASVSICIGKSSRGSAREQLILVAARPCATIKS